MLSRISRRITTACLPSVSFSYSFRRFASSLPPSTVRPISAPVTFLLKRGEKLTVDGTVEECLEQGKYVQRVIARGKHQQLIDERGLYGGLDVGPSPYDLLLAALGGCTSMTLRIYLDRKSLSHTVPPLRIDLLHAKKPASELVECPSTIPPRTLCDLFELTLSSTNDAAVPHELRANLLEIAAKCPVHKTLAGNPTTFVRTRWKEDESMDSTTAHALGSSA